MNIKELLPVGSVVLLNNGRKRLMITGVKQTDEDGKGREYDYIGVLYPEGYVGPDFQYLFNQEDIVKIYFRGYEDGERDGFINQLAALYEQAPTAE